MQGCLVAESLRLNRAWFRSRRTALCLTLLGGIAASGCNEELTGDRPVATFRPAAWKSATKVSGERRELFEALIATRELIGMHESELKSLLGEYDFERHSEKTPWPGYTLGYYDPTGFDGGTPFNLVIVTSGGLVSGYRTPTTARGDAVR